MNGPQSQTGDVVCTITYGVKGYEWLLIEFANLDESLVCALRSYAQPNIIIFPKSLVLQRKLFRKIQQSESSLLFKTLLLHCFRTVYYYY